jgi:hypothetical protein
MRHFRVGTLTALLLLLLPLGLSSCNIGAFGTTSCACASPADPNWTPPPVSDVQAAADAAKAAGLPAMKAEFAGSFQGRSIYQATAAGTLAFVDGESGVVFEVLAVDQMPNEVTTVPPTAAARTAAQAFLARTGLGTDGLTVAGGIKTSAGVSAYDFTWTDSLGSAKFLISVNPATDSVFAYADLRTELPLALPMVGRARASQLAIDADDRPGNQVLSADLTVEFGTGAQVSTWMVGLGVPTATDPNVYEHGAAIQIDALTGAATVLKSS